MVLGTLLSDPEAPHSVFRASSIHGWPPIFNALLWDVVRPSGMAVITSQINDLIAEQCGWESMAALFALDFGTYILEDPAASREEE